jgi:hypothetical protein
LSIVVSITTRIGFNIANNIDAVDNDLDYSFEHNTWFYPLYELFLDLFASICPIASTIYSLMYMVTHKKNIISLELHQQEGLLSTTSHATTDLQLKSTRDSFQAMLDFEEGLEEVGDSNFMQTFSGDQTYFNGAKMNMNGSKNINPQVYYRNGKKYINK